MICSLEKVCLTYVEKPVLDHVDLVINEKEKWGVVGLNGAGKSTLLKVLARLETPQEGKVTVLPSARIAYCAQDLEWDEEKTVLEAVLDSPRGEKIEEYEAKSMLSKLKMNDPTLKLKLCSGGQRKRVALAKALLQPADLLLLDEPTNHLDQEMILWLEKTLIRMNKAIVLVTHDRYFLNRITDRMIEVDEGKLYTYQGNYADYLQQREQRLSQRAAKERKRQSFLRKEVEWIRRGAQARSTKSKERIARFERISAEKGLTEKTALKIESAAARLGNKTIEFSHLSKAYGEKTLFSDFSYLIQRHDRIGIIGENGCGKTTLLRLILREITPDQGTIEIGETVRIGYFSQTSAHLDPNKRVLEILEEVGKQVTTADGETISAAMMLERFLFTRDQQYMPVKKCSGGQKRRLALLLVLMQAPNILLLDEPTNDLDVETLTVLEEYLENFNGAVLAVSHDRYFLDKIADRLFVFENGRISVLTCDYSGYLERREKEAESQERIKPKKEKERPKTNPARLTYLEKKELDELERKLSEMEAEVARLESQLAESGTDYARLCAIGAALNEARQRLETAGERWLELSEKEAAGA